VFTGDQPQRPFDVARVEHAADPAGTALAAKQADGCLAVAAQDGASLCKGYLVEDDTVASAGDVARTAIPPSVS
jgi:hypothetical protein